MRKLSIAMLSLPINKTQFARFVIDEGSAKTIPKAVEKAAGMIATATNALNNGQYRKVVIVCVSLRFKHGKALRNGHAHILAESDFLRGQALWHQKLDGLAKAAFEKAKETDPNFSPMEIASWLNVCSPSGKGSR